MKFEEVYTNIIEEFGDDQNIIKDAIRIAIDKYEIDSDTANYIIDMIDIEDDDTAESIASKIVMQSTE